MPSLYLIRHGEPENGGTLLGRTDPPLSQQGRRQMRGIRQTFAAVYTSTLRRARESAALLSAESAVLILPELDEISHGVWDGKKWEEIERDFPELASKKLTDWLGVTPPGGESWADFTVRVERAIGIIRQGSFPAAVVGHLAVNACIASRISSASPLGYRQAYGQIDRYEI